MTTLTIPFVPTSRNKTNKYNSINVYVPLDPENPDGPKTMTYIKSFESGDDEAILQHVKEVHDLYVSLGYDDLVDPDEGFKKAQMFRALLKGEAQSKWNQFYTETTQQLAPADNDEFEPMEAHRTTLTLWLTEHLTDEEIGRTIRSDLNSTSLNYPQGWTTNQV
mmetsp:Transcript_15726/g.39140  ORF Transcript_15726/g.39140 Transcript_15726/m.39140 type:complete len:164 (-) Transcript_15726:1459-1950(-)